MFRELIIRTPIAATAATLLLVGAASAATAVSTGTTTVAHYHDGVKRGTFSHIDDGDTFRVCDTYADGHGVTAHILQEEPITNDWSIRRSADDGGDAGCDSFTFDIKGGEDYMMRVCWKGAGFWDDDCTDKRIIE